MNPSTQAFYSRYVAPAPVPAPASASNFIFDSYHPGPAISGQEEGSRTGGGGGRSSKLTLTYKMKHRRHDGWSS